MNIDFAKALLAMQANNDEEEDVDMSKTPRTSEEITQKDVTFLQAFIAEAKSQGLRIEVADIGTTSNRTQTLEGLTVRLVAVGPVNSARTAEAKERLNLLVQAFSEGDARF